MVYGLWSMVYGLWSIYYHNFLTFSTDIQTINVEVGEIVNSAWRPFDPHRFNLLCIDTENKFISTGLAKDIADAALGKYHQITKADGSKIASVTNQALNEIKAS